MYPHFTVCSTGIPSFILKVLLRCAFYDAIFHLLSHHPAVAASEIIFGVGDRRGEARRVESRGPKARQRGLGFCGGGSHRRVFMHYVPPHCLSPCVELLEYTCNYACDWRGRGKYMACIPITLSWGYMSPVSPLVPTPMARSLAS